jgi:IS30 family transposase
MIGRPPPPAAPKSGPAMRPAVPPKVAGQDTACRVVERVSPTLRRSKTQLKCQSPSNQGSLVIGKGGKTAMGTLVERTSRHLVPVALPDGRDSAAVCGGVIDSVAGMPANLLKSITWDQGIEMARHAALTLQARTRRRSSATGRRGSNR